MGKLRGFNGLGNGLVELVVAPVTIGNEEETDVRDDEEGTGGVCVGGASEDGEPCDDEDENGRGTAPVGEDSTADPYENLITFWPNLDVFIYSLRC